MAGIIASGLFNAFAFTSASYLFKVMDHMNYFKGIKQHNKALEELTQLHVNTWYENEMNFNTKAKN